MSCLNLEHLPSPPHLDGPLGPLINQRTDLFHTKVAGGALTVECPALFLFGVLLAISGVLGYLLDPA